MPANTGAGGEGPVLSPRGSIGALTPRFTVSRAGSLEVMEAEMSEAKKGRIAKTNQYGELQTCSEKYLVDNTEEVIRWVAVRMHGGFRALLSDGRIDEVVAARRSDAGGDDNDPEVPSKLETKSARGLSKVNTSTQQV